MGTLLTINLESFWFGSQGTPPLLSLLESLPNKDREPDKHYDMLQKHVNINY